MNTSSARSTAKTEPPSAARPEPTPTRPTANKPAILAVVPNTPSVKAPTKPTTRRAAASEVRQPSVKEPAKPASAGPAAANTSPGNKGLTGEQASKVATASVKAAAAADQAKLAANPPPPPSMPKSWADIKVGSLVIAHESVVDGWWEAIVTEVNGDKLTIKWRDYPRQPTVIRGKAEIAFLAKAT